MLHFLGGHPVVFKVFVILRSRILNRNMSDQGPSPKRLKVKMEPEIVGESVDVKAKEMEKIVTITKDEIKKMEVR